MPVMAYSPLEQGRLAHGMLDRIAEAAGTTALVIALAWVLRQPGVVAIPKAGTRAHVEMNLAAAALDLPPATWAELDRAFPPPVAPVPLEVL